jgi:hypothetical protein
MSSKRNLRRRSCEGKGRTTDLTAAGAALAWSNRTFPGGENSPLPLPFCDRYHLGHPRLTEKRTRHNARVLENK